MSQEVIQLHCQYNDWTLDKINVLFVLVFNHITGRVVAEISKFKMVSFLFFITGINFTVS